MALQEFNKLHHCVYKLQYHLVLVTKYRRKALNAEMISAMEQWTRDIVEGRWGGHLIELSGEADHVHILFEAPPTLGLTKAVNALKTATSRRLRKGFQAECTRYYSKPVFWSRSYCLLSVGGAPLELLKTYIQNQAVPG